MKILRINGAQNGSQSFRSLDLAFQGRPHLRAELDRAKHVFGDDKGSLLEHAITTTLACVNLGIVDRDEAERGGENKLAIDTAIYHPLREVELPRFLNQHDQRALQFFRVLREIDETMEWKRYEQAVKDYKDVLIAMYVRMVDIYITATDPELAAQLEHLRMLHPRSRTYPGAEDLKELNKDSAKAILIFYGPFALYLSPVLYSKLMDTAMFILYPRAYGVVKDALKKMEKRLEHTEDFLLSCLRDTICPAIRDYLSDNVELVGAIARRKGSGSIIAKWILKKGISEADIHEETVEKL